MREAQQPRTGDEMTSCRILSEETVACADPEPAPPQVGTDCAGRECLGGLRRCKDAWRASWPSDEEYARDEVNLADGIEMSRACPGSAGPLLFLNAPAPQ